jgi:hypothetical protein
MEVVVVMLVLLQRVVLVVKCLLLAWKLDEERLHWSHLLNLVVVLQ